MNSPLLCLAALAAAILTATVPAQPPANPPTDPSAAPAPALDPWRERAARAEAWLKNQATTAERSAADAFARAKRELLGVEAPVSAASLAIASRPTDHVNPDPSSLIWLPIDEKTLATIPAIDQTTVVLVHGLDEPGTIWDELTPHLLDHGAVVIRFDYPNDQSLTDSSRDLTTALRRLRSLGYAHVSLVAHSMGGLVCREVLTSDDAYAGSAQLTPTLPAIDHLIMCGTPNHGSPLAKLQAVAEAREQIVRRVQGTAAEGSGLVGFSGDGCGEAGRDLCEGSEFLAALNARPLPTNVKMTTICGVITPAGACEYLKTEATAQWASLLGADRAAALTAQASALVTTLGDGMVPAASTRLDGVIDHVEIAADHRSMLKRWTILKKLDELRGVKVTPAEAIPVILDRLGLEPIPAIESEDVVPRAE